MSILHSTDLPPDDLLPTSQAARLAGVHLVTVYRWIRRRQLRAWRLVGRLRVSRAELLALVRPVEKGERQRQETPRSRQTAHARASQKLDEAGW